MGEQKEARTESRTASSTVDWSEGDGAIMASATKLDSGRRKVRDGEQRSKRLTVRGLMMHSGARTCPREERVEVAIVFILQPFHSYSMIMRMNGMEGSVA